MRGSGNRQGFGKRVRASGVVSLVAGLVLLLAACGDPTGETGASAPPEEEQPPAAGEEAPEPPAADDEEPAPPAEDDEPAEEAPADEAPAEPTADERCQIAIGDDPPMDPDDYEPLVMPINGSLEELTFAMDAALTDLEEGGDGPSLEHELQQHAETWADLVEPVQGITPPDGAEDWHGSLIDSWLLVCEAIEDGLAGSAEGNDERFDAFVDALRDFPSLVNRLHANAACGPFEDC